MKDWKAISAVVVCMLGLLGSNLLPAVAQETMDAVEHGDMGARKMIHLFSADFPPNPLAKYPAPPVKETRIWQLLDREMATTDNLILTENLEDADYRVELRCGGVFSCSKLLVDVKSPDRVLLTSFSIKHIAPFFGLGAPKLPFVAQQLSVKLDEHLKLLDQGGYGHLE